MKYVNIVPLLWNTMRIFSFAWFISGKDSSLGDDFYIGARDHINEGVWRATETDYKCGALNFTNWLHWEPDNWKGSEDCAVIIVSRGGKWSDRSCAVSVQFSCQVFE